MAPLGRGGRGSPGFLHKVLGQDGGEGLEMQIVYLHVTRACHLQSTLLLDTLPDLLQIPWHCESAPVYHVPLDL